MAKYQIKNARLSFPDLFEPSQFNEQSKPSYKAQFLVPAVGDDAMVRADVSTEPGTTKWGDWKPAKLGIDVAIQETAKAKWGAKAPAIIASIEGNPMKICWIDGKKRPYDGYDGNWSLSAARWEEKGRPLVVDANRTPLAARDGKPYGGCYVNAVVTFWAQDNKDGKAVRCELVSVQFAKYGDSFGGGGTRGSADDFEDVSEGAGADDLA